MLVLNDKKINGVQYKNNVIARQPVAFKSAVGTGSSSDLAKVSTENLQAYALTFLGKAKKTKPVNNIIPDTYKVDGDFIDDAAEAIKGKNYQGAGLFEDGYINWDKVGWDNLQNEPLDWDKASDKDFVSFYHALALAETKDCNWVRKFNETNVPEQLATYHSLVSTDAKKSHAENLEMLKSDKVNQYPQASILDRPLIKNGKFNLEFTIFDTETTGANGNPKKGPVDKIIQIGAVKVGEDGEVKPKTAISQFVNPEMPVNPEAEKVHHISDEKLKDKPVIESLLRRFMDDYLKGQLLVAYNAKFDIPMLNRAIDSYNAQSAKDLLDSPLSLCLDPFILLQRIHPFIGAKKKLSEQYKFLFGRTMEGAHDALDDVKGTADVLKYCCYYLQKHANRPLTVKDVLTFQFGGKVEGLDLKINERGYDASKSFRSSYRKDAIPVKNFNDGWKISVPRGSQNDPEQNVLLKVLPLIGEENTNKLESLKNKSWQTKQGVIANLKSLDLKPYDGKDVNQIIDIILEQSVNYINYKTVKVWRKNVHTDYLYYGNDMPDVNVAREIMKERKVQDAKTSGEGRTLDEVLADLQK